MKNKVLYYLLFLVCMSCIGQSKELSKFEAGRVSEIIIKNKVNCSVHKLKQDKIIISDLATKEKIIRLFSKSQKMEGNVALSYNNGFFDIEIIEGGKSYFYGIVYSVYDGIVINDNNNGDQYKNDVFESEIYSMFVIN
jgi:hypothetical protein